MQAIDIELLVNEAAKCNSAQHVKPVTTVASTELHRFIALLTL